MKAARMHALKDLRLENIDKPEVKPNTILMKVRACAICGSDIRIMNSGNNRVTYPAVIGHETSGEIVGVGAGVSKFKVGDRIALGADVPCGRCNHCHNGRGNCCDENHALGYQFPGAFAEYCLLNEMMVNYGPIIKVPDHVSYEQAALMEPLACVLNGFELAQMQVGKSVLIMGAGPIGCLGIMVAKTLGASRIVVSEPNTARLEQAKKFGADSYVHPDSLQGQFDLVFTMCPSVKAHEQAIDLVAKRGYVNFFGGLPKDAPLANLNSNKIHYKECFVMGSHGSTPRHNQVAMDLISAGRIPVGDLISHTFSLDDIHQGIEVMQNLEGLKVIIKPQ
jgi:L-iditol 2-dehydrogenase